MCDSKTPVVVGVSAVGLLVVAVAYGIGAQPFSGPNPTETQDTTTLAIRKVVEWPVQPQTFTLAFSGDILTHMPLVHSATAAGGLGNLVTPMQPWLFNADLSVCSLEIPLALPGHAPTGFPLFGAPPEYVGQIRDVGWDVCVTSGNHPLDQGVDGAINTLNQMDAVGLGHVGTGRSQAETSTPTYVSLERDGVEMTVALIGATTFHNDYSDPASYQEYVNPFDTATIIATATEARNHADLVVLLPHWGQEYWSQPDGLQQAAAQELDASGVIDAVIGDHPHVPQPIEQMPNGM